MNNIITIFIIVPILAFILLGLNLLLSPHKPYEAKVSTYECGFQTVPLQTRSNFQIQFYIVGLLFLLFDLELLLAFPAGVTLFEIGTYGFFLVITFFVLLTIGFIYEIGSGAISLEKLNILKK
jgi:NADH-ubiquinone oxidoreductase chain 3